ncbi:hypothetical protein ANO11243_096250 [Dothideomycetidae sp. 11243]|nr:hypothetical protein ANO11243_096250 [fungal sp. No.11243]
MAADQFTFIVSDGPELAKDPKIRRLNSDSASTDSVDSPEDEVTSTSGPLVAIRTPDTDDLTVSRDYIDDSYPFDLDSFSPFAPSDKSPMIMFPFFSPYEITRARNSLDISELSMLTNFNVGGGIKLVMGSDTSRLVTLLQHKQWSFVQYVPAYYGTSECITLATDCLLSKVRSVLNADPKLERTSLRLYTACLRSLQRALRDPTECTKPEVLCATQLLGLYELFNPDAESSAYAHHLDGCVRLIRHRSPTSFTTDFEKALFAAHTGPCELDAIRNNYPCYLDTDQWREVYSSLVVDTEELNERCQLAIDVRLEFFALPGLWHDVELSLTTSTLFLSPSTQSALESRCRKMNASFSSWMSRYAQHTRSRPSVSDIESAKRRELYGMALECGPVVKRLLASVCEDERIELEKEAMQMSRELLALQARPGPAHAWLYNMHEANIARSVIASNHRWMEGNEGLDEMAVKRARRGRYLDWVRMMGRVPKCADEERFGAVEVNHNAYVWN